MSIPNSIVFSSNISIFFCEHDWNMSFAGEHPQWPHDVPTCPHIPSYVTPTTDIARCSGHCLSAAAMMSGILIIRCFFRLSDIHHSFAFIYRQMSHLKVNKKVFAEDEEKLMRSFSRLFRFHSCLPSHLRSLLSLGGANSHHGD